MVMTGQSGRQVIGVVFAVVAAAAGGRAHGQASDQAAAIVIYPYVVVDSARGIDTTIQFSNAASERAITARCALLDANGHCAADGRVCRHAEDCPGGDPCVPGWLGTDFRVRLTSGQPLAWRASRGLPPDEVPLDGVTRVGPRGESNFYTVVPPIPEDPFAGMLFCYAIDDDAYAPIERNDLKGEATIEQYQQEPPRLDVAKYNAVGFQAIPGRNNGDESLVLGGEEAEYTGCRNVDLINHFFDGAVEPVSGTRNVFTTLVLIPCDQDLILYLRTGKTPVQFLVYDEYGSRYTRYAMLGPYLASPLSDIDPRLFDYSVVGSLSVQTRIRGLDSGLIALVIEQHVDPTDPTRVASAAVNVHGQGNRVRADVIGYRRAICGDGVVDPPERCDDGNTVAGDCCSATCQPEPAGQPCADDANACTDDRCDGRGACVHAPYEPLPEGCGCCQFESLAEAPNGCVGDLDGDGVVNSAEVEICQRFKQLGYRSSCDADLSGSIDPFEIAMVRDNYTYGCPAGATVCTGPADSSVCGPLTANRSVPLEACDRTSPAAAAAGCPALRATYTPTPSTTPMATPSASETSTLGPTATATPTGVAPNCCTAGNTPGCSDPGCQLCVCGKDGLCCVERWGERCVGIARQECAAACRCWQCAGDCDGDDVVTIAELVRSVRAALDPDRIGDCWAADRNDDGTVTINELVAAVDRALSGCGAS